MFERLAALAASALVAVLSPGAAEASPRLQVGLYDDAHSFFLTESSFQKYASLRAQVVRINLNWDAVARSRPLLPTEPIDPAYDWSLYDRVVAAANSRGIGLVVSIIGTPAWANGGRPRTYAPLNPLDLQNFAFAAARRYPSVTRWMAWNEPNLSTFLQPQWEQVAGRWVAVSPATYAAICNAVFAGVHAAGTLLGIGEQVACGVTSPRGNNAPRASNPSVSPIPFLRGMQAAGAVFDAYAHHPYATSRFESPRSRPSGSRTISLGNIGVLVGELDRLYPGRRPRIWITEYGYQTNPPDRLFGVSWKRQAAYLRQAHAIARRNPRIDIFIWFLLKDEPQVSRWQSGLISARGKKKPAFWAFKSLPR